jgi:hypothetical protein
MLWSMPLDSSINVSPAEIQWKDVLSSSWGTEEVTTVTRGDSKRQRLPKKSIDEFNDINDCILFPDDDEVKVRWYNKNQNCLDPFRSSADSRETESFYTETIPEASNLNFSMSMNKELDRGNRYLASYQALCPPWLDKRGLQTFTTLRHGPLQQLQRICDAVKDDLLPFENENVRALLCQTLHHLGPLEVNASGTVVFPWQPEGIWKRMRDVTLELIIRKRDNITRHRVALLVADLCSFLSQWLLDADDTDDLFSTSTAMCMWWADNERNELNKIEAMKQVNQDHVREKRAREALFNGYALLCTKKKLGKLTQEEVENIIKRLVQLNTGRAFADDIDSSPTGAGAGAGSHRTFSVFFRTVQTLCEYSLTRLLPEIVALASDDTLSAALKTVYSQAPEGLMWKKMGSVGVASTEAGRTYSINLLDGLVLIDGFPIHSLPDQIKKNPLYVRSFEDRDFEVTREGNSWKTTRSASGFNYIFTICNNNEIRIEEIEEINNEK